MLQVYLDNVDDLLVERKKKSKPKAQPPSDEKLKIVLAEHSSTGMVQVEGAETKSATTAFEVLDIFAKGSRYVLAVDLSYFYNLICIICVLIQLLVNEII